MAEFSIILTRYVLQLKTLNLLLFEYLVTSFNKRINVLQEEEILFFLDRKFNYVIGVVFREKY